MLAGCWFPSVLRGAEPVAVIGITEPIKDITMAFASLGVVAVRPLAEGDPVKQGQVLIELDKRLEELDAERRRLTRDLAKVELDRVKTLAERKALSVTQEELDRRQAEYDVARVEYDSALEVVRRRLIIAPMDGHVVQFYKDVGEKCDEQQPVLRMVDTRRCYFVGNVEAAVGHRLKLGQRLALEVEGAGGPLRLEGAVAYLSPVVDPSSGLLKFKVLFDNPDGRVRPGVTGRAILP